MPKQIWTFDCETDPFLFGRVPSPFMWGLYNGSDYFEFERTEDFINVIKNIDGIFFAHNGGKFDFHFIAQYLKRNEKIMMINSRLVKAHIGKAEIRDSYALLPFPLSAYKKDEIDYNKLEKNKRHLYMDEIKSYLRSDCIYLYELIDNFFIQYGRHLTAPSAAIKQLMKIEGIKIENPGRYFFSEFQKHYYGGRCECIKAGVFKNEITYIDINSAYAFAMQHEHPIGNEWKFIHENNPEIVGSGFYTIEARSFGALCRREKNSLKFDWDGELRKYNTTGWELIAGLETGKIKDVSHIEQKIFKETQNFKKFIDHFWTLRQLSAKNTPENLFAKLMMNSAYGKFAANPENYDTFVLYDPAISEFLVKEGWELRGEIGTHIIASKPIDESDMRFYNVATGASITGFVRSILLRAMSAVENPIYCDTDSIIFSGKSNGIELSDNLGAWKLEGIYNEGYFGGKKLYALRNKNEIKMAHKGARLDFNDIKQIAEGKIIKYQQPAPTLSWYKQPTFLERNIQKTAA